MGDTITVVTKKAERHHGEWITTGDIRVKFSSARAAGSAYEQQRSQHHSKNTQVERLLGHTWQVCATLISTGHYGETAQDETLHKAFVACAHFRGKDISSLLQLFRDSLQELYDKLYDIDAEQLSHLEDFYTALSGATETSGDSHTAALDTLTHYISSNSTRSSRSAVSYACIEWQGIKIRRKGPLDHVLQRQERGRRSHFALLRAKPIKTRTGHRRPPRRQD